MTLNGLAGRAKIRGFNATSFFKSADWFGSPLDRRGTTEEIGKYSGSALPIMRRTAGGGF